MAQTIGFNEDEDGYWIAKDATAIKDYKLDFSEWLQTGDFLTNAVFTVPAPLNKTNEAINGAFAYVTIGGGVNGATYEVTAHIVTSKGLEDDRRFRIVIRDN